jgi:hypothetical protein
MTSTPYDPVLVAPGTVSVGEEPQATPSGQWADDDVDVDYDELGGES